MSFSFIHETALSCHPATRSRAVERIGVRVHRMTDGRLTFSYVIEGDLSQLRLPAPQPARFTDGLWQHTCCEAFISIPGQPAYHEFNFSPSTHWAAYAFDSYRQRAHEQDIQQLNPRITVRSTDKKLELDAVVRLDRLSSHHADSTLSLAISTVIEDRDGVISYWALKHPPGEPDFHHANAFASKLASDL